MTNLTNMTNAALVDAYGALKAEQSELAKREKALKAQLASRMDRGGALLALDGNAYRVTRSFVERSTLDTARVKELLADPPMKTSSSITYRVSARVAEAA